MMTLPIPDEVPHEDELAEALRRMHAASKAFYVLAQRTNVHAFLEFTGLMNEFIQLCSLAAQQGIDFRHLNVHGGAHLPFHEGHRRYLAEKLECIYGVRVKFGEAIVHKGVLL